MVEKFPGVRLGLENVARERQAANQERLRMVRSVPLERFLGSEQRRDQSGDVRVAIILDPAASAGPRGAGVDRGKPSTLGPSGAPSPAQRS